WPQFSRSDGTSFDDFLARFEDIFVQERIHPSKKFACFRRCLNEIDPSVLRSSRALDIRNFDTAVTRLRPFLDAPFVQPPTPTPEVDINDIMWPQFSPDDKESFNEFLERFERIFTDEGINPSKKFVCLQRCLTLVDRQTILNSHAMDDRRFEVAVERLKPLLNVPEEQRLKRIRSAYIDIAQKHNQPLESYYDAFIR
ncbi:hypothetical protein BGX21_007455, partial [Mortierella sp. AD011]